jgi:hypothetical protein
MAVRLQLLSTPSTALQSRALPRLPRGQPPLLLLSQALQRLQNPLLLAAWLYCRLALPALAVGCVSPGRQAALRHLHVPIHIGLTCVPHVGVSCPGIYTGCCCCC